MADPSWVWPSMNKAMADKHLMGAKPLVDGAFLWPAWATIRNYAVAPYSNYIFVPRPFLLARTERSLRQRCLVSPHVAVTCSLPGERCAFFLYIPSLNFMLFFNRYIPCTETQQRPCAFCRLRWTGHPPHDQTRPERYRRACTPFKQIRIWSTSTEANCCSR